MNRYANQTALEHEVGPTVRPMQGLPTNKHGSSWLLQLGDSLKTLVDIRSETNDAEVLCASVGVAPLFAGGVAGAFIDLIGRVTWGIGGASFQTDIDLNNGLTFSVPANFLRIDASYQGTPPSSGGPRNFQVSAGVGYGTIAQTSSPTRRTTRLGSIPPGGTVLVPVPFFAVSFAVFKGESFPTAAPINIILFNGSLTGQSYIYADPSNTSVQSEISFSIGNGVTLAEITNPNAFALSVGILWNLSI